MEFKFRTLGLSICIASSFIYGLDLNKYPINTKIDVTEYPNGKYGIEVIKRASNTNKPLYFTPKSDIYKVDLNTTNYKTKYGDISIYNLSPLKYLNALDYDYIKLDGNITGCTVAISDQKLFLLDDNLPLDTNKKNDIELSTIYPNIDLSRLKSIILFKSKPECNITSISFLKDNSHTYSYNNQKATWIWNPKSDISINQLKKYNINKIYLQMKDGFKETISRLKENNITIFGLNGSPEDIYNYKYLEKDIELLAKLKETNPHIKGYQIDVEPYTLKAFQTDRETTILKYINMLESLSSLCHQNNLQFSVVSPFWYNTIYYKHNNLAKVILKYADEVVLMSYRSDLSQVINISKEILQMGDFSHKNIYIGIELMYIPDEKHTRYNVISSTSCLDKSGFIKECKSLEKIREYTVKGSSISFYNQIDKLSSIDDRNISFKSFKGFVLHHYGVLP